MKTIRTIFILLTLISFFAGCAEERNCDAVMNEFAGGAYKDNLNMFLTIQSNLDKGRIDNARRAVSLGVLTYAAGIYKLALQDKYVIDQDCKRMLSDAKILFSGTNRPSWVSNFPPGVKREIDVFLDSK